MRLLMTIRTYLDRSRVRLNLKQKVDKTLKMSPPPTPSTPSQTKLTHWPIIRIWGLVINPVVPGRGTGLGSAKVAKMPGWARGGVLNRPCGTGPGYGAGSAKIADMPGWARGGAGPAPRARRVRAGLAGVAGLCNLNFCRGTGLNPQKSNFHI